jgi:tetratricopeptide (TPR) repeat protein
MSEHELWNELGNLYFMSGAYDQAAFAYHRSIRMDGFFGRPYSNLALTYVQQGKYDQAIDLYRRSLDLLCDDKEKAVSWSRLGNVYRHLKNYEQAVSAYQQADAMDPDNSETRAASDQILYGSPVVSISHAELLNMTKSVPNHEQVDLTAALPEASTDISTDGDRPSLDAVTESWAAAQTSQPEIAAAPEAEAHPEGADPVGEEADLDLSIFFEDEAEVYYPELDAEALGEWLPIPEPLEPPALSDDLNQASEPGQDMPVEAGELSYPTEDPAYESVETWTPVTPLLTARTLTTGEIDRGAQPTATEGAKQPLRIVEIDIDEQAPDVFLVTRSSGEDLFRDGAVNHDNEHKQRAAEESDLNIELEIPKLKRLVQVNPRNAVTWNTLGNLYKSAGLYREAIMAYQQATSIDPDKAEYYHNLGMVYGAEGRDEDAIIALQKVLELKPDHSLTHATLGGYYQKLGFEELAQKHIGKAMKHIYDSESEYNRACLEAICGNTDQAIDLLRVALENKQTYVDWVLRDPDLDMIREDRRFKQLISDFT